MGLTLVGSCRVDSQFPVETILEMRVNRQDWYQEKPAFFLITPSLDYTKFCINQMRSLNLRI